jgi:hypothetical protein
MVHGQPTLWGLLPLPADRTDAILALEETPVFLDAEVVE